jgi:DNA-binding MarR family transcriptional regulator
MPPAPAADPAHSVDQATHAEVARDVVAALMNVKTWIRETHQWVYSEKTAAALFALAVIERNGPARVTALAETARVDASVVSRQAAQLEHAGLVERKPDPEDGRAQRLSITDAGREVLEDGRVKLATIVTERLAGWDPEELRTFTGTLRRLVADLSAHPNCL